MGIQSTGFSGIDEEDNGLSYKNEQKKKQRQMVQKKIVERI